MPAKADPAAARRKVDVSVSPWSAIGQVNNSAYGRCTGVLIGRRLAITAAHCLRNPRTRRFMRPQSIHFVLGYDRGDYAFQSTAESFRIGAEYNPASPMETVASDWALLTLKEPAPADVEPARISQAPTSAGRPFISAGFAQERSYVLTKTPPCRLQGEVSDALIVGVCDVPKGYSGGPLIDEETGEMIGIQVASGSSKGTRLVIAIPPSAWQSDLAP